ncbi:MAG: XTP/dITP diphosphatase [Thermoplasmatales archaeon]
MIFVTSNMGKYEEYKSVFRENGIDLELRLMSYPEEQLSSIEEVARRSLCYLTGIIKEDFFIDDSGIFINATNGFPGVYSSYVSKTIGNEGILKLMHGVKDRSAQFITCIAYYDGDVHIFLGVKKGRISETARGSNGFGFDPIFIPEGSEKTYAEMSLKEKNLISHRSAAVSLFIDFIKKKDK